MKRLSPYELEIEKTAGMQIPAIIYASEKMDIDTKAIQQIQDAAKIPGVAHVIGTPDIHAGYGVPIGCVLAAKNVVSPSAVGYDINCGMRLITTPFQKKDLDVKDLANKIAREIPLGEGKSNIALPKKAFHEVITHGLTRYELVISQDKRLSDYFDSDELEQDILKTEDKGSMNGNPDAVSAIALNRGSTQLGTLGGGNHFLEIQEITEIYDEEKAKVYGLEKGMITVMFHSGSRGFGHEIAGDYMKLALSFCKTNNISIPSRELSFLAADSQAGINFVGAMHAAANFAYVNRLIMVNLVRSVIRRHFGKNISLSSVYDVPHNMVKQEGHFGNSLWVHRKGATRAFSPELMKNSPFNNSGQPVIIPGSMGTFSYVLAGIETGNKSLYSVCHGAGRVMSRTEAAGKNRKGKTIKQAAISDEDFKKSMENVFLICQDKKSIKEEAPAAYKDINEVIEIITGEKLALKVARMKPLAVLKG